MKLQRWKEDIFFDHNNKPYIQHVTNEAGRWVDADTTQEVLDKAVKLMNYALQENRLSENLLMAMGGFIATYKTEKLT